jgi:glycerol-3-phosphate O-acyltransferase
MVEDLGPLPRWVLSQVLSSVDFARNLVDSLRDAEEHGTIVYAMRTRSIIDYAYFNLAFLEHGLKPVRFANGVNSWMLRSLKDAAKTVVRGKRGLPDDLDCLESAVADDQPALLFLRQPRGREIEQFTYALPYLERLVEYQRRAERPIFVVPQLLVWEKRPDRVRHSMLDDVLGTSQSPTFIKKAYYVVQNIWQSFLNLGRPTVQHSSAINLKRFVDARNELSDLKIAEELRSNITDALHREEQIVVGPWAKSAEQMTREILSDRRTQRRLREYDIHLDDPATAQEAEELLKEIAADFSPLLLKFWSAFLHPVWNQLYDGIEIDHEGLEKLRETARDKRIVIVPSHKSHVDYLLISYIFYQHGLIPPHVAAGVNLSFWPLGPIFRKSGAFFLRRTFGDNKLYATLFHAYLVKLLEEEFSVEFFIEGTRSRTGKLNPPKYGMLNMIVDAFRDGNVDELAFIPVSVGYEKIIEGSAYRKELEGGEKQQESIGGLLKTSQILQSEYGRVYVEFADPVDLGDFLESYHEDPTDIPEEDLARSVRRLAYRIIHGINDVTTVTPSAIAGLLILNSIGKGIDEETLVKQAGFVIGYLEERDARFSRTIKHAIDARVAHLSQSTPVSHDIDDFDEFDQAFFESDESQDASSSEEQDEVLGRAITPSLRGALQLLQDNDIIHSSTVSGETIFSVEDERRVELAFYMNNILHYFLDDAVFATAAHATFQEHGDEGLPIKELEEHALFLSRMLKFEFCFEERLNFETVFDRAKNTFLDYGWLVVSDDVDELKFPDARPCAGFEFVRGLLHATIESYYLVLTYISGLNEFTDKKTVVKSIVESGQNRFLKGELSHPEANAKSTIENALKLLREWKVIESRENDRGRKTTYEIKLNTTVAGQRYEKLRDRLSMYLRSQKRSSLQKLSRRRDVTGEDTDAAQ